MFARAQTVRWEPSDSGLANTAQLVFDGCAPEGEPQLPSIPGVTFTRVAESTSTNIVNFQVTRSVILTYQIRGRQSGPLAIPTFNVRTDKGVMRVPPFNAATPAPPLDSVASAKLVPERASVWAGEVFGLTYELSASRRTNPQISPSFDWNAAPLVAEDWTKPEVSEAVLNGERRVNVLFRTRAVSKTPNTLKIEAATHVLSIQTGTIGFGIISQPRMEQVSVTSDQPTIEVRALPAPPADFSGAVGQFKLVSKIVPEKAAVGEPVTWTLELSGTGNWPDIAGLPSREVSNDFQVVQPKGKRTPTEGKLFDVALAEDVVLVPAKAGTYALGPVNFTYFEPKSGTYKTITAPRTSVAITAPVAPQFSSGPPPGSMGEKPEAGMEPEATVSRPPASPPPPAPIPRDPLPGTGHARVPWSGQVVAVLLSAPFGLLLGFWLFLAVRRAKQTDPVRVRRESRDHLGEVLDQLGTASDAARPALLLAWQRDAAVLWQIPLAAPSASAFHARAESSPAMFGPGRRREAPPDSRAWAALWVEADRALYGAKTVLPPDWVSRAQAALAATHVPGFKPLRLFLPQNLMPFAAMFVVSFIATASSIGGAEVEALTSYQKGDFATAEKSWRVTLENNPTDWNARHNLSLALAQQEQATEAAAQASAAFVQQPNNPSVRWHFALAAEKGATASATLARFLTPDPVHSLGRLTSPGNWQLILVLAAWTAAASAGWLLLDAYKLRTTPARRRTAWTLIVVAVLVCVSASVGGHSYGLAADAESVIVARASTLRSIPTEAETTQKSSPLAPGTLALADKTFLSWTRLSFENGQTGWVRKVDLVPLWK